MKLINTLLKSWTYQYSNFPESYIKRTTEKIYWKNPKGPQYKPNAVMQKKKIKYGEHMPWTREFNEQNSHGRHHAKIFLEPVLQWGFFRGDRVEILVGKDKGKQGIVNQIVQERNWVFVEGMNTILKNLSPGNKQPDAYVRVERPLLVTNQVALVDPADLKPTPVEWRFTEDGEKVRVSTRTGRIIPIPASNEETRDYKSKSVYAEQPKDTVASEADKITFQPKLCTFEMEIMEKFGIVDNRVPPKSWWY